MIERDPLDVQGRDPALTTRLWREMPSDRPPPPKLVTLGYVRHAYSPEKIGTVLKIWDKIKRFLPFCLILSRS